MTELEPVLLCSLDAAEARCALWAMETGHEALLLFSDSQRAEAYLAEGSLAGAWRPVTPPRAGLQAVLRESLAAGVQYAALDVAEGECRTIYDLRQVLRAADAADGEPWLPLQ